MGNTDIEDSLERLDKLTQEEARMASAELLKMTHNVNTKVTGVDDRVKAVDNRVQDVGKDVCGDVQDVRNKVQGISREVRGVDDKLDQVNRSLLFHLLLVVSSTQTVLQGTNSEIAFSDGFRPQIHPSIITLHPKLVTTVQLDGSFKAVYLMNGNPPTHSC